METTSTAVALTKPSDREILIERTFDAPRELVWRAFTEPDLVARWWGRGNKLTIERDEVRAGGHWRYIEHAPEGAEGFEGRYREVTPPERIARTFEWDGMPGYPSVETIQFTEEGGRTHMVANELFFTSEERDGMLAYGMESGTNASYAALDALLETLR